MIVTALIIALSFVCLALAAGFALSPALRGYLVPQPNYSKLADSLSFSHVDSDGMTLVSKNNDVAQVVQVKGCQLEILSKEGERTLNEKKNYWLMEESKHNTVIKIITLRERVGVKVEASYQNPVLDQIDEKTTQRFQDTFRNVHHVVFMLRASKASLFKREGEAKTKIGALSEIVDKFIEQMSVFGPERLTLGQGTASPLLGFYSKLVNGSYLPIPAQPDCTDQRLALSTVEFDSTQGKISYVRGSHRTYSKIISLSVWGEKSTAKIIQDLLALPCELAILEHLETLGKTKAQAYLGYQEEQAGISFRNKSNSNNNKKRAVKELEQAGQLIEDEEASLYFLQLSVQIKASSQEELDKYIKEARLVFANYGATPIEEQGALEYVWRAFHIGREKQVRPTTLLSHNVAHLTPFGAEPTGLLTSAWGKGPICYFPTIRGNAYSFQFHQTEESEALGHTLIVAPAGSGKTVLAERLIAGALRHPDVRAFLFDRHYGTAVFCNSIGAAYNDASLEAFKLNPLACSDTPGNRDYVRKFLIELSGCGKYNNGKLTINYEDERAADLAVDIIFDLPLEQRILTDLYQPAFNINSNLRKGLQTWIGDSPLARWFNGYRLVDGHKQAHDTLDLTENRVIGFEMTDVFNNVQAAGHVIQHMMDQINFTVASHGMPHLIFFDEIAQCLKNEIFVSRFQSCLQESRKNMGVVMLCVQDVINILESPIASTIINQTPTKIFFQNQEADYEQHKVFGLTDFEWDFVKRKSMIAHRYPRAILIKTPFDSAIVDANLGYLGPLFNVFCSGRQKVLLMKDLQQKWKDKWLPHYLEAA